MFVKAQHERVPFNQYNNFIEKELAKYELTKMKRVQNPEKFMQAQTDGSRQKKDLLDGVDEVKFYLQVDDQISEVDIEVENEEDNEAVILDTHDSQIINTPVKGFKYQDVRLEETPTLGEFRPSPQKLRSFYDSFARQSMVQLEKDPPNLQPKMESKDVIISPIGGIE